MGHILDLVLQWLKAILHLFDVKWPLIGHQISLNTGHLGGQVKSINIKQEPVIALSLDSIKQESAIKHAQNAKIQIILQIHKVSSWAQLFKASLA